MPTVAIIGAELFPIPPIRGGAAELFIEQVASRLQGWRPVVISRADPELPEREHKGQVEYQRIPLSGWRFRLYKRYPQVFPLYDRQVTQDRSDSKTGLDPCSQPPPAGLISAKTSWRPDTGHFTPP